MLQLWNLDELDSRASQHVQEDVRSRCVEPKFVASCNIDVFGGISGSVDSKTVEYDTVRVTADQKSAAAKNPWL
jgi:hypothetical protein